MSGPTTMNVLTPAETQALVRLAWAIDQFRELHRKIPASYISTFIAVATKPGFGPTEYAKAIGTIQPIASRMLLEIGPKKREGCEEGLGLIAQRRSLKNLRQIEYDLSPEGAALAKHVARIVALRSNRAV